MINEIRLNRSYKSRSTARLKSKFIEYPPIGEQKRIRINFTEQVDDKLRYTNAFLSKNLFLQQILPKNVNEENHENRKNRSSIKRKTTINRDCQVRHLENEDKKINNDCNKSAPKSRISGKMNMTIFSSNSRRHEMSSTAVEQEDNISTVKTKFLNSSSLTTIFQPIIANKQIRSNEIENKFAKFDEIAPIILSRENVPNLLHIDQKEKESHNRHSRLSKMEDLYGNKNCWITTGRSNSELKDNLSKLIKEKVENELNSRYTLIPDQNAQKFIPSGTPLNKIATKCTKEIKFGEEIDRILDKEKMKEIIHNVKRYNKKIFRKRKNKDQIIIDGIDKEIARSLSEKVFIYDNKGEGNFLSNTKGGLTQMEKIDRVAKISENLAFNNRQKYMDQFGYNYLADTDFLFLGELENQIKLREKKKKKIKELKKKANKYKEVDDCLERTIKEKAYVISKVSRDIDRMCTRYESPFGNIDEVSDIFTEKEELPSTFYNMGKDKARSMTDIRREVFSNLDKKLRHTNFKF